MLPGYPGRENKSMTQKKKIVIMALTALLLSLLAGCGSDSVPSTEAAPVTEDAAAASEDASAATEETVRTIGYYTDCEILQSIPDMVTGGFFGSTSECNDSCYMATYMGTTREAFIEYQSLLQQNGYTLAADNGEDGINGEVYYAALQKDGITIHLVYELRSARTCVIVGEKENLSEHLTYREEYKAGAIDGAHTSLTMTDRAKLGGLGMFLQLKNGHFVVWDGGEKEDAENLLARMEQMTPDGEKPVIEAWFLTHGHDDHYGAIQFFTDRKDLCNRMVVNGVYVNAPNAEWIRLCGGSEAFTAVKLFSYMVKDENGNNPLIYRSVEGQKYYFCDVEMEVITSPEFVPYTNGVNDLNDTSVMMMLNIEGQKVMITGDADTGAQYNAMSAFRREYFDLAVYQVPHHGINTLRAFVDYAANIGTALDPNRVLLDSLSDNGATPYLMEHCDEFYYQGRDRGTLRVTFPYKTGDIEILGNDYTFYPDWKGNNFTQDLYIEG